MEFSMGTLTKALKVLALSLGMLTGTLLCTVECPETMAASGYLDSPAIVWSLVPLEDSSGER